MAVLFTAWRTDIALISVADMRLQSAAVSIGFPVTAGLLFCPCRMFCGLKPLLVLRGSWSSPTCFTASTETHWWGPRSSPTTSLWRTSSRPSSTWRFVSFASWHGQFGGGGECSLCARCLSWNYISPRLAVTDRLGTVARVAVATGGRTGDHYSMIAFSSWDYGSLGEKETKLKQKNILYRLQVRRMPSSRQQAGPVGVFYQTISVFLSGGSGGGAVKETSSVPNVKTEDTVVFPSCYSVFPCIGAHYRRPDGHLHGHSVQSGKWKECGVMMQLWFKIVVWKASFVLLTGKERAGGIPGFDYPVSSIHRHHCRKLCGASSVWPDRPAGAIQSKSYCHSCTTEVCTRSFWKRFKRNEQTCI